jgi:hypothetical protein
VVSAVTANVIVVVPMVRAALFMFTCATASFMNGLSAVS